MFSFFKKRNLVTDINWLGPDIHSHILPGIDDGSKNVEQSLTYVRSLHDLGFQKMFFTPHIFGELYPNTKESILNSLKLLTDALDSSNINLIGGAAAEHMVDYSFNIGDELLCLPDKHILIEMSYLSETPNIEQVIFDLQVKGYKVILAHPERYNFYHGNITRYHRLREMGCYFQLNLLSITGYYGKGVKQATEYLLSKELYDLAGTDLHHDKHLSLLDRVIKSGELHKLIGYYQFKNMELFG
ncbi:Tyrosine-protein phosphatase YwqE [Pedobacter westerhofensis]|uniref:protein-tyrosine-phosphatase n=1 Tax=Pedobacter westerhofensis TaxID=425512 RepID=A0A521C8Y5_9SPHI|nr:CpsB/CapC family capsule biosynthesis tyrosine phosphatase [Pedobacter westerhofensis]SMO55853.1 Tyrosine-protein phosphatase YwqE [Pedobacter westerhofensis]